MPNTTSARKALRQTVRRRARNLEKKASIKTALKAFKKLATEKKADEAHAALSRVFAAADKVAKTDYIKKNKASRIKSRASKFLKKSLGEQL